MFKRKKLNSHNKFKKMESIFIVREFTNKVNAKFL